jgi:esterase
MNLYYRKYGNGPPLIILHGLYGSSDNWVTIAKNISGKYTVYLPDLRNHGRSPHSPEHTYAAMADDLFEMVEDLGIDKFILAGHSMGGKVAMSFALNWPEKLNSLIVIDISPFGSTDRDNPFYIQHRKILETLISIDLHGCKSRNDVENLLSVKIDSERISSFLMKNLTRTDSGLFAWKLNTSSLLKNLSNITEGVIKPGDDFLPVTGFRVIFIKGELSDYISEADLGKIQNIFPAAEIVIVSNAGHWINAERPDAIEKIILDQLEG